MKLQNNITINVIMYFMSPNQCLVTFVQLKSFQLVECIEIVIRMNKRTGLYCKLVSSDLNLTPTVRVILLFFVVRYC